MPDSGWITATGEGSHQFNATGPLVLALTTQVISATSPQIRLIGSLFPRRLKYAGSIGVSNTLNTDRNGVLREFIGFTKFVLWETEYTNIQNNNVAADTMFWRLPLGLSLAFRVTW